MYLVSQKPNNQRKEWWEYAEEEKNYKKYRKWTCTEWTNDISEEIHGSCEVCCTINEKLINGIQWWWNESIFILY